MIHLMISQISGNHVLMKGFLNFDANLVSNIIKRKVCKKSVKKPKKWRSENLNIQEPINAQQVRKIM